MRTPASLLAGARRGRRPGNPYREVSVTDALAGLPDEPPAPLTAPVYTPASPRPDRPTRPIPELAVEPGPAPRIARPYVPDGCPLDKRVPVCAAAAPLIGDSIPFPPAAPPQQPPASPVNLLPDSVPYCAPGWAGLLMSRRVRQGEWEDVRVIVDRGRGRNAADEVTSRRHARAGIAEAARQLCAALGQPEMTGVLLGRVAALEAVRGGAR